MGAKADVDQRAIEELAEHYGAKGRAVGRLGIVVGAIAGVLVGSVPLSPLGFAWPIPSSYGFATVLVGLGVGLLLGFVIGDSRARMYHRMAEQARAQLVLEERISKSDARIAQLVAALTARARTAAPQPQPPQTQPQPQAAVLPPVVPEPAAPAPVAPVPPVVPVAPAPVQPQLRVAAAAPPLSVLPAAEAVAAPSVEPAAAEPPTEPEQQQQVAASVGTVFAAPPLSPPVSG